LNVLTDDVVHFPHSLHELLDGKEVLLVREVSSVHEFLVGLHLSVDRNLLDVTETVEVLDTLLLLGNKQSVSNVNHETINRLLVVVI
jgi:hypothetical protein